MNTTVVTDRKQVTDRRKLAFASMQDIDRDVHGLGPDETTIRVTGNWSAAQILGHVTYFIDGALDGFDFEVPLHFKLLGKLFKKGALAKPVKAGFDMPKVVAAAATPSRYLRWSEALEHFEATMARLEAGERMVKPSPVFGSMSHEEWEQLHCRHAELHLSFIHRQPLD